ncbi:ParM/StbA family protein [Herpetosiphon geysericola]|uniref:Uncharacterized protein n=1 Tax=Herpetosiphon geysericola TaxID=70996 RepID=A0A0P6YZW0_9CHLR|nr:ParM/StbA family protein [Herpetosiphon geysericola]KPL90005.1 hypothetical protein SE18_08615 [Herpetosiphon geysericola]
MTNTAMLAIGINPGFGNTKIVVNNGAGDEKSIVFPSIVAKAQRQVPGALEQIQTIQIKDESFWVGEDALIGSPRSEINKARLKDDYFIPALVRAGLEWLEVPREPSVAVSGLPASWADELDTATRLGELLRIAAAHTFSGSKIRIVSEPLGVLYSQVLDARGARVRPELAKSRVLIVDIGHYTVNAVVVNNLRPEPAMSFSLDLGTSTVLARIGQLLFASYEMDLTLFQIDQAVRNKGLLVSGEFLPLPPKAELVLADAGMKIVAKLTELLRGGGAIEKVLIGGGGAEMESLAQPIVDKYRQAIVVPNPQLSVATGFARLARYSINKGGQ